MQLTADDDAKAWLGPSHVLQIKIRPQVSRTIINTKRRRKCLIKIGNALMPSEETSISVTNFRFFKDMYVWISVMYQS